MIVCPSVCRSLYVFLSYSFGHCIICPSVCRSLYVFLSYSFGHCSLSVLLLVDHCMSFCPILLAIVLSALPFYLLILITSILFTDSDYLYFIYRFWLPLFYLQILNTSMVSSNFSWTCLEIQKYLKKIKKCYPLANKVVKGCSNATVRLSVTSLWTL
jgi:hypothetical protein